MNIRLLSGEPLDLPVDFSVEISRINPFFSDYGEHSIPVLLPPSDNNARLLGYPHDIGLGRIRTSFDITLEDGAFFYPAKMVLLSANEDDGYECSFVLNLGKMYSCMQTDKLSSVVEKQYARLDYNTATAAMLHLEKVAQQGEMTDDDLFDIFPVLSSSHILNEYNDTAPCDGRVFAGYQDRNIDINGKVTVIPAGFLITPFLRLRPLLIRLFKHYGYTVVEWGILDQHPYKDIVLLNNNYDTLANGYITPLQIAPDCSVSELISAVENKFVSKFVVDESSTSVRFIHFDALLDASDTELSDRLSGKITFSYPIKYRRLEIKSASYISPSFPPGIDKESYEQTSDLKETLRKKEGLCVDVRTGILYRFLLQQNMFGRLLAVGTLIADYSDEHKDYDAVTLDCGDTVPSIQRPLGKTAFNDVAILQMGDGRWLNSFCRLTDGSEEKDDKFGELPIMFAIPVSGQGALRQGGLIDEDTQKSLLYHGDNGLFALFGRRYDELLRYGLTATEAVVQLRGVDKMNLSATNPIVISGNRFLPESLEYSTQADSISTLKLQSLTMKPHLSVIEESHQSDAEFLSSLGRSMTSLPRYTWEVVFQWRYSPVPMNAYGGAYIEIFHGDMFACPPAHSNPPGTLSGEGEEYPNALYHYSVAYQKLADVFALRGDRVIPAPTSSEISAGDPFVYAVSQIDAGDNSIPQPGSTAIEPDQSGESNTNSTPFKYFILYLCLKPKSL